jgi:heavy metal translocating P-type ATPase
LLAANGAPAVASAAAAEATATLELAGMWCSSCSWLIGETLARAPGVAAAEVSFVQRQARVRYDPARTDPRRLLRRVRRLGYRAWLPGDKPWDEEESLWYRLIIASVFVLHDAVLSLTLYGRDLLGLASAETEWLVHFFNWMSLLACVPVILLLGWPVLRAGLASLARGRPNIHTLIALGATAAFVLSLRNLLLAPTTGYVRVYFETTTVLFFLVGLGHYLEIKARQKGTQAVDALFRRLPAEATVLIPAGVQRIGTDRLGKGMRVRVEPGERFPADGLIAEGAGDVDESLLTGEPEPVFRRSGDRVLAGTVNLDGRFDVITTAVGAETVAGQIGRLLHEALWQRAPVERLADRLAAVMTPLAVVLALATFGFWAWRADTETGLVYALSVLLIACPCALGIATPLTLWVALGRAAEMGVILRSTGALEALAGIRRAFFDKTGTLTRHPITLQAVASDGVDETALLAYVAAAEQGVEHPLARAIAQAAATLGAGMQTTPPVTDVRRLPGRGVVATVADTALVIGSARLMAEQGLAVPAALAVQQRLWQEAGWSVVFVGWEGRVRGALALGETPRPEIPAMLAACERLGIAVTVLTGDDARAGERWQRRLGVSVLAEQRPEDKLAVLRAAGEGVLMVGDGINDGPALAAATVGVGLVQGADVAQAAADVILLGDDLRLIPWLIDLAVQAMRRIRQNLIWAFLYNGVGLALAVSGHLQPVIAALLMVLNSLLVTRNGLRLHTAPLAPLEALSASGDAVPSSLPASLPAPSLLPHG